MATDNVRFQAHESLGKSAGADKHQHSHDGGAAHSHGAQEHGHTHEHLENAGKYSERDMPDYKGRDWSERAFTIGIGG